MIKTLRCYSDKRWEGHVGVNVLLAEVRGHKMGMSMAQLLKLRKAISGISIGALSKATNREHDCIEPWELSTVLEDVLKIAKEMDQVRFSNGQEAKKRG